MTKPSNTSSDLVKSVLAKRLAKNTEKDVQVPETSELRQAFIDRFSLEKLENWKKEYGNRELVCLRTHEGMAVLRPPMAEELSEYMIQIGTNGMDKAVAYIVNELWIDGDIAVVDNDDSFNALFLQINQILEGKKAECFRF